VSKLDLHRIATRLASVCPDCRGSGFDTRTLENCPTCGGTGKTGDAPTLQPPAAAEEEKEYEVTMRVVGYKFITVRAKNRDEAETKANDSGLEQWTDLNEENSDIVGVEEVPPGPAGSAALNQ